MSLFMLVSAGIEFIFFRIASRELGFDFVLASVGNTQLFSLLLSSACTGSRHFPAPHPTPPVRRLGVHKNLREDKPE